jgi:hypothetical protein
MTGTLLVSLVVVLIIVGLLIYLVDSLPIAPPFKLAARALLILAVILYLLQLLGLVRLPA